MKKNDNINGYIVQEDDHSVGQCRWSFAVKDGSEYFIKEFLQPVYPTPDSPGSEETKALKRKRCKEFAEHHENIMAALAGKSGFGGNLIVAQDFFLHTSRYYKVTAKVNVSTISINDISKLSTENKLLILKTVAHSLRILHSAKIVHGDLKPDNILIKETDEKTLTTKLIDFDSSYFSEKPPLNSENVVGDAVYYSPELGQYIEDRDSTTPETLQVKSDIFALGLIYHQYLTGKMPAFDPEKYKYAYASVLDGVDLTIDNSIPENMRCLLQEMLQQDYKKRPLIVEVFERLKRPDIIMDGESPKRPEIKDDDIETTSVGIVDVFPSPPPPKKKLSGTLLKPKPDVSPASDSSDPDDSPATDSPAPPLPKGKLGGTLPHK
jgi:serine/threonine protein kinase